MVYVALSDGIRGPVGVKLTVNLTPTPGIDPGCQVWCDVEHGLFLELAVVVFVIDGWRTVSKLRVT